MYDPLALDRQRTDQMLLQRRADRTGQHRLYRLLAQTQEATALPSNSFLRADGSFPEAPVAAQRARGGRRLRALGRRTASECSHQPAA